MDKQLKEKVAVAAKSYVSKVFEVYSECYDVEDLINPDVYENWFNGEGCVEGVVNQMDEKDQDEYWNYWEKNLEDAEYHTYGLMYKYAREEAKSIEIELNK